MTDGAAGAVGLGLASASVLALIACLAAWSLATRLKRAHGEIARLSDLLAATPDQFLANDGVEERTSPGLAALLGVTHISYDALPARFENADALRTALAGSSPFDVTLRTLAGRTLRIAGNRAAGATVLVFRDVTGDMSRNETLAADRDRFRALLDLVPIPMWRRGADLAPSFVNRA
jgi:PAS domain-containing protein